MRLITREEPIGGLEISTSRIRICLATKTKKGAELVQIEEPLPPGAIVDGVIRQSEQVQEALARGLKKVSDTSYFVVSIPPVGVYTRVLSYPSSISGERLDEAVRLAISFQLPFEQKDANVDYEVLSDGEGSAVLVGAAPHTLIDTYIAVLQAAGIKAVAVESHVLSLRRAVSVAHPFLVQIPYSDFTTVAMLEGAIVRFARTIPHSRFAGADALKEEVRKLKDYCTTEFSADLKEVPLSSLTPQAPYDTLLPAPQSDWLIALGALIRGQLPQGSDTLVSLLPVGTEQAYTYQKAVAFAGFTSKLVIGVAAFFVLAYAGTWALAQSLKVQAAQNTVTLSTSADSSAILAQEQEAQMFNDLLEVTGGLVRQMPVWSTFIETLRSRVTDGITITGLSADVPENGLQMTGAAKTRAQLNAFRKSLQETPGIAEVVIPLANLELKENIPFVATLKLAEPQNLYAH